MKGYKAFDKKFRGIDFQFREGKTYTVNKPLAIGKSGFHFCTDPVFIIRYYNWQTQLDTRFAEIEASGTIINDSVDKYAAQTIRIVREISRDEFIMRGTGKFVDLVGNQYWYDRAELHRDAGPAVIYRLRSRNDNIKYEYYRRGKLHCTTRAARVYTDDTQEWYYDGQLHRDGDEPAVYSSTIVEAEAHVTRESKWYCHGMLHRIGGPAIKEEWHHQVILKQYKTIVDTWYENGLRHRAGGPAVTVSQILLNGDHPECIETVEWWTHGQRIYKKS